jgi:DNA-binding transcriptional regulator YiaG
MENGRSMSDYMRGGPAGLRGVVVGRATPGGTPVNYNPHDLSKTTINIVDQNGASVRDFSLDQVTEDRVRAAMAIAAEAAPGDDIESIRERAAMAFEEMAKSAHASVRRVPVVAQTSNAPPPAVENPDPDPVDEAPPIEKVDRSYSPMAALGFKKKTGATPSATAAKAGPPTKLVYFEKEGIGTVHAFFHDVIVACDEIEEADSGFIVLVYDLRFEQHAARWFPPANDPYGRPWAVKIDNDDRLFLVHTTGFQYVYDTREYCILTVERAVVAGGD